MLVVGLSPIATKQLEHGSFVLYRNYPLLASGLIIKIEHSALPRCLFCNDLIVGVYHVYIE